MNKPCLIIALLILHIPLIEIYANKDTSHSKICTTALSKRREELAMFYKAIEQEDLKTLLTFNDIDWDVSTRYKAGHTLLSFAAQEGKIESIKTLVSQIKVKINSKDEHGWTPLHHAVLNLDIPSRTNTVYTLVRLGANVHALNNEGSKPSAYTRDKKHAIVTSEQEHQVIYLALVIKDTLEVAQLLQINAHILSRLVEDFETNNHLPVH